MAEYNEDALYNMSDEELEAAFNAAKADSVSPDVGYDNNEEDVDTTDDGDDVEYVEEEEEVEDLEQPEDQDSDDDASSDDEVEDEVKEETEETEDGDADGQPDEDEADTADTEDATTSKEQPVQSYKFKANGKEYEFTDSEIVEQFPKIFGQAMDYTKKMQAIKPWRKTIDAIESAQLSHDDVNLMIDVLKGDKGAISEVIKRTGIDTLELDVEENKYTPKDYGRDENTLAIKDVVERISHDPEYAVTERVLGKEWDDRSWKEISSNPEMIELLHIDVKTGMYDKVQPIAEKLKVYGKGAKSDLDYYKEAAGIYFSQLDQAKRQSEMAARAEAEAARKSEERNRLEAVKQQEAKRKQTKQVAEQRKAAAPTKRAAGTKKATNYLDESDEAFEEWYAKLGDM